jgi:HK97 gp10 family phage protein
MNDVTIKYNEAGIKELEKRAEEYLAGLADKIKDEAKSIVPVRTGKLRDSIEVIDGETNKIKYIGSDVDYAIYVELGTVKTDPKPYLRPALYDVINSG